MEPRTQGRSSSTGSLESRQNCNEEYGKNSIFYSDTVELFLPTSNHFGRNLGGSRYRSMQVSEATIMVLVLYILVCVVLHISVNITVVAHKQALHYTSSR
eukprot:scaffold88291_cov37-Attheya_sp.AAC.1